MVVYSVYIDAGAFGRTQVTIEPLCSCSCEVPASTVLNYTFNEREKIRFIVHFARKKILINVVDMASFNVVFAYVMETGTIMMNVYWFIVKLTCKTCSAGEICDKECDPTDNAATIGCKPTNSTAATPGCSGHGRCVCDECICDVDDKVSTGAGYRCVICITAGFVCLGSSFVCWKVLPVSTAILRS